MELLQRLHQQRAPPAERQHPDRRRHERPLLPGHAKGDIVWEYVSPYFARDARLAAPGKPVLETNWVYRAQPVPYNWVPAGTPRSEKAVTPPELGKFRVVTN
jgi:hypothetical protein